MLKVPIVSVYIKLDRRHFSIAQALFSFPLEVKSLGITLYFHAIFVCVQCVMHQS